MIEIEPDGKNGNEKCIYKCFTSHKKRKKQHTHTHTKEFDEDETKTQWKTSSSKNDE